MIREDFVRIVLAGHNHVLSALNAHRTLLLRFRRDYVLSFCLSSLTFGSELLANVRRKQVLHTSNAS